MTLKRFKTDWRLWFWISLVIFAVLWFVPLDIFYGHRPVILWVSFFTDFFADPFSIYKSESLSYIGHFFLYFGAIAIPVGWVIQCIAVIVRDTKRKKTRNAA